MSIGENTIATIESMVNIGIIIGSMVDNTPSMI